MKDVLAFIGVVSLVVFGFIVACTDDTTNTPLTPEEKARIAYNKKYKRDQEQFEYMKKRIPSTATDVKYVGDRWVTFYLFDQCMVAQANGNHGYAYLGLSAVSSSVCEQSVHGIPEFNYDPYKSTVNGEVQY